MTSSERILEGELISKLQELKYSYREDIRDRATLEANFREKFQQLNRVKLTDGEFARLLEEIVTPDVITAADFGSLAR
jgi:type I restriction enzyme, R subunit